jgi:hypothetical protein
LMSKVAQNGVVLSCAGTLFDLNLMNKTSKLTDKVVMIRTPSRNAVI